MLKINSLKDLHTIRKKKVLPELLLQELEQYFKELVQNLTGEENVWSSYNLKKDGSILVLQPEIDNPADLQEFGLDAEYGGLFAAPIEFTSKVELPEMTFFKTVLVLNNSFCIVIYSEVGKFGAALDEYLSEFQCE